MVTHIDLIERNNSETSNDIKMLHMVDPHIISAVTMATLHRQQWKNAVTHRFQHEIVSSDVI